MRVYPAPLDIGDEEGFSTTKDLFGRRHLGSGMSHLVATVEDPLVIAFDGPWGSGKTTFLKMWAGELRKAGHPVIFFDAFENDYVDDAFAALAREIIELAEASKLPDVKTVETIRKSAVRLGTMLLKSSAKIGMKVAVRAATAGLANSEDFKDAAKDIDKEAEGAVDAYMNELLEKPHKQWEIVQQFRESLTTLPGLISPPGDEGRQKPLIFIIDELDRCKPYFALSLLERVKHFMAVPNVHFVLGVHMRQLQGSVRYAYGSDIDAAAYLQKFVNLTIFNIEVPEDARTTDLHRYAQHLAKSLNIRTNGESPLNSSIEPIVRLIQYEKMSYRTLERAFTILALAIGMAPEGRLQLGPIMGGLVMMKLLNPELFIRAKQGTLTLKQASDFLRFPIQDSGAELTKIEEKWWNYCLAVNLSEEEKRFGENIKFRYNIFSRSDIIKFTANHVIDLLEPS